MEEKRRGEKNGKEFQEYRYVTSSRLLLALFPSYVSGRPRQASVLSSRKQVLLGGQALLRDWSTESIRRSAPLPLSLPLSLSLLPSLSLSLSLSLSSPLSLFLAIQMEQKGFRDEFHLCTRKREARCCHGSGTTPLLLAPCSLLRPVTKASNK